jgi:SagB-type dehydrogenase family enzyme
MYCCGARARKKVRWLGAATVLGIFYVVVLASQMCKGDERGKEMKIMLEKPSFYGKKSVEEALLQRRSVRDFKDEPLTLMDVSQLLWAAQGKVGEFRTVPSAGALYPLEVYLVARKVVGLSAGVYHYEVQEHALKPVIGKDVSGALASAALWQNFIAQAPANIVIAGDYERCAKKYGQRAKRYVDMESGMAVQNVLLQATALGLGGVVVGAFDDMQVQKILGISPKEVPLAIIPVGRGSK